MNGPLAARKSIARALDAPDAAVSLRYFGLRQGSNALDSLSLVRLADCQAETARSEPCLNHLAFAAGIVLDGRDVTDQVIDTLARETDDTGAAILCGLRMVPSGYLQYFYRTPEKVAEQQAEAKSRAELVMEIEEQLLTLYQDPNLAEKPAILEQRGGAWYSTVATTLIAAIVGNLGEVHIVNTRNRGAIPDLPPECAVEVPAVIDARGATPVAQGPLPLRVRGLVQQVKAYEQLTVQAAVTGEREAAIWALVNNPLVGSYRAAVELIDRFLEAHHEHLPAFAVANSRHDPP